MHPVKWIDEVLDIALQYQPKPFTDEEYAELEAKQKETGTSERISTH